MKIKHILPIIFGVLSIFSCSKDIETTFEISQPQEEGYTIPIEDALSSLEDFMIDRGMVMTKGGFADYIDSYFTVSAPSTKAASTKENVLYAVNFKEESGYALLAADTRIQEDILAITDQGNVTENDFNEPILEKIPTDNDDLSVSEYDAMVESGALAAIDKQINKQCFEYARKIIDEGGSGSSSSSTVTYSWKTVKEVPRMLNTVWTQSTEPFNKYCPEVG